MGVRAFPSLVYPHKPEMAAWLNSWAADFARQHDDVVHTATFFPEPGAGEYAADALRAGARVFKAHVQVGGYDPTDRLLDPVWGLLEDTGTPVVIHCGSGPAPGRHTGPGPVTEVLARHRGMKGEAATKEAAALLDRVGIPDPRRRLKEYPHQLSGGMRQRVMIAMALANDPRLLIADEPTTALDVTIQAQILELIRTLQDDTGTAVLLITHDLGVVAEVGDDVAVTVVVPGPRWLGQEADLTAQARAGPS